MHAGARRRRPRGCLPTRRTTEDVTINPPLSRFEIEAQCNATAPGAGASSCALFWEPGIACWEVADVPFEARGFGYKQLLDALQARVRVRVRVGLGLGLGLGLRLGLGLAAARRTAGAAVEHRSHSHRRQSNSVRVPHTTSQYR